MLEILLTESIATLAATGGPDPEAVKHITTGVDFARMLAPIFSGLIARYGLSALKVIAGLKKSPLLLRSIAAILGVLAGVAVAVANGTLDALALEPLLATLGDSIIGLLVAFGLYDLRSGSWRPKSST